MTYDELRERVALTIGPIEDDPPAHCTMRDEWYIAEFGEHADAAIRAVIEALAQEAEYHGGYWMMSHRKDVPTRRASEWLRAHLPEDQR